MYEFKNVFYLFIAFIILFLSLSFYRLSFYTYLYKYFIVFILWRFQMLSDFFLSGQTRFVVVLTLNLGLKNKPWNGHI